MFTGLKRLVHNRCRRYAAPRFFPLAPQSKLSGMFPAVHPKPPLRGSFARYSNETSHHVQRYPSFVTASEALGYHLSSRRTGLAFSRSRLSRVRESSANVIKARNVLIVLQHD
jgi:hypothetical protein